MRISSVIQCHVLLLEFNSINNLINPTARFNIIAQNVVKYQTKPPKIEIEV
ncbi:hypothetical protein HpBGD114_11610 [Helicobacter pylori]